MKRRGGIVINDVSGRCRSVIDGGTWRVGQDLRTLWRILEPRPLTRSPRGEESLDAFDSHSSLASSAISVAKDITQGDNLVRDKKKLWRRWDQILVVPILITS